MEGIKLSLFPPQSLSLQGKGVWTDWVLTMVFSVLMAVQKLHLLTVLGDAKISVWLRKQEKVEGKGFSFASSVSYLLQLT